MIHLANDNSKSFFRRGLALNLRFKTSPIFLLIHVTRSLHALSCSVLATPSLSWYAVAGVVLLLTLEQYNALKKYRNAEIPATSQLDAMTQYLLDRGLICMLRNKLTMHLDCDATYLKTFCVLTPLGAEALEKFEDQMRNDHAELQKNKEMMKMQSASDRFNTMVFGTISAVVGSVIGGLIVYYWPAIVDFFDDFFH